MIFPSFIWGLASCLLSLFSLLPYLWVTLKGSNKPHVFTWCIWTILTGIAFAAQISGGAGAGAWATGVTFLCCVLILAASFRHGEKTITRMDWLVFAISLLIIPVWMATKNPGIAAILVTTADGLAYIPTLMKAWRKPWEEMAFTHISANIKHIFSLFAMHTYSIATTFYPAALIIFNFILAAVIIGRRLMASQRKQKNVI